MKQIDSLKPLDSMDQRLRQLREEFDSGFARPWESQRADKNITLCFIAAGQRLAAPLTQLRSIAKAGPIVPMPSQAPALLGLTVLRAKLMPVFSLAVLLEVPATLAEVCWLAVLSGRRSAALAVDSLVGYADQEPVQGTPAGVMPPHTNGFVPYGDQLHALLDCTGIYDRITQDRPTPTKDQDTRP
ncbi:MAG TPA: chemotaxis protein CheW [Acidobacteriaceae bacterium]|jgi:chemotaxis signal transduction protein|nr:chemotaxis protein CheW [Acidobacteriaceae bacterium]